MADLIEYIDGKNGVRFSLDRDVISLGRDKQCDIVIDDELISKSHAIIERSKISHDSQLHRFTICDMNSTNGTHINGERVERASLWNGDLIQLGMRFFRFNDSNMTEHDFSKTTELRKSWIPGLYYTKKKD